MNKIMRLMMIILTMLFALSLTGCAKTEPVKHVTLSNLEPVPAPEQGPKETLRVALAVGLSPTQSIARYQTLTTYLSGKLNSGPMPLAPAYP